MLTYASRGKRAREREIERDMCTHFISKFAQTKSAKTDCEQSIFTSIVNNKVNKLNEMNANASMIHVMSVLCAATIAFCSSSFRDSTFDYTVQ